MFAEMLLNSKEKIFLEAIDQLFEHEDNDSMFDSNEIADFDFKMEKMNDKFCDSLIEDMNSSTNITSTELDYSDDTSYQSNIFAPKKKLFISDYVIINQANVNKIKNEILADYYALINKINAMN